MRLSSASHQLILLSCLLLLLSAVTSRVAFHNPKPSTCCEKHETNLPKIQLKKCLILPATDKCLESVLFVDIRNRRHCFSTTAPWINERIAIFEKKHGKCEKKY